MTLKFEATWSVTDSRPHWVFSILCFLLLSLLMVNDRHLLASALAAPSVGTLPAVLAALSVGPFPTTRLLLILALSSFPGPHVPLDHEAASRQSDVLRPAFCSQVYLAGRFGGLIPRPSPLL